MGDSLFTLVLMFAVGGPVAPVVLPGMDKFESRESCERLGAAAVQTHFFMKPGSPASPIAGYACFYRPKESAAERPTKGVDGTASSKIIPDFIAR